MVVWTLPDELQEGNGSRTYIQAAVRIIHTAKTAIWIVSPFLESYGVGHLIDALLAAMRRGVNVTIVAHDIEQLSGASAKALEGLRRELIRGKGSLSVYTVHADGRLLVHPKIVLADSSAVLLGSANVTRSGMERNLEVGVVLGADAAAEVTLRVQKLVASSLVRRINSPA